MTMAATCVYGLPVKTLTARQSPSHTSKLPVCRLDARTVAAWSAGTSIVWPFGPAITKAATRIQGIFHLSLPCDDGLLELERKSRACGSIGVRIFRQDLVSAYDDSFA